MNIEHEPSLLSYDCMRLVEEMGPIDQPYRLQLPHRWTGSPPEIAAFPDGSGPAIPVSQLVKDLGVQTDYMLSPSVQCTEIGNKARRLTIKIRYSF